MKRYIAFVPLREDSVRKYFRAKREDMFDAENLSALLLGDLLKAKWFI